MGNNLDLATIRLFVKVVQHGSFSRAAEALKLPKSTVSKAISRIEAETGTKLLLRTTRSLTLTAAGRAFYESCLGPIQSLEDAHKSLSGQDTLIAGRLRITAPEDFGPGVLARKISELTKRYPQLSFELLYTNQVVDLVKDGFDIAIRIGRLKPSSLRAKKIGDVILAVVASPAYLKSAPKLKDLDDLQNHVCLTLGSTGLETHWRLVSKKENRTVAIRPRVVTSSMTSLLNVCRFGGGIALVPLHLIQDELEKGQLTRVLPEWGSPGFPVSLVTPLPTASSARLKLVSEILFEGLQEILS